ncbi:glycosyltransferase [candidate division WOR-3 bacterium]|nr:glycosyltransferase [candidate division WOR-3 bacterium]
MARPDVALFLPFPCWGGVETVFLNLARHFAGRGLEVEAVFSVADGPLLDDFAACARVVDLGNRLMRLHRRERWGVFDWPAFRRYVRARDPRSLLAAKSTCNWCVARAKRDLGFPGRAVVSHHIDVRAGRAALGWLQRAVADRLESRYRYADAVVGVARAIADGLIESGMEPGKVHTIHNPVVTDELYRRAGEPCPHDWLAHKRGPVVLGAGRLTYQKDFGNLLRAFRVVLDQVPDCRLAIIGDGPDRPALERLAGELGLAERVDLPGTAANPCPYMKHADLYVLSSRYEGFGMTLVEAMALGTPVVSTDCPCGPAEVLDSGRHGALVPVGDHLALARAMKEALLHPGPACDRVAWARKMFSVEAAGAKYLDLLLPGKGPEAGRA